MMPGMNPKMMKQAMKRMGIKQEEIDAQQVIIRCADKEILIDSPQVAKVNMMGSDTYQVSGEISERSIDSKPTINEEDVKTVMEQTEVTEEKAREAIEETDGDLAQAIINLSH